jgi:hypothetical protein
MYVTHGCNLFYFLCTLMNMSTIVWFNFTAISFILKDKLRGAGEWDRTWRPSGHDSRRKRPSVLEMAVKSNHIL